MNSDSECDWEFEDSIEDQELDAIISQIEHQTRKVHSILVNAYLVALYVTRPPSR